MRKLFISTDSTAAVTEELQSHLGIVVVPFTLRGDGFSLEDRILGIDEAEKTLSPSVSNAQSLPPSAAQYEEIFDDLADKNGDILHISCGSFLSSAYGNALKAAKNTMVKFRRASVYVVDSHADGAGHALVLERAVSLAGQGLSPAEMYVELSQLAARLEQYVVSPLSDEKTFALTGVDDSGRPYRMRKYSSFTAACAAIGKACKAAGISSAFYLYGSADVGLLLKAASRLRKEGCSDIRINSMSICSCLKWGARAVYAAFEGNPRRFEEKPVYSPGRATDFFTLDDED